MKSNWKSKTILMVYKHEKSQIKVWLAEYKVYGECIYDFTKGKPLHVNACTVRFPFIPAFALPEKIAYLDL